MPLGTILRVITTDSCRIASRGMHGNSFTLNLPGSSRIILKSSGCTSHEKRFFREFPASCETTALSASRYGEIRTISSSRMLDRSRELLLQVTPVNQVPEAVTTHGIRGQNTRAVRSTDYTDDRYLVPLSPPPRHLLRSASDPFLPVGHACRIYVHTLQCQGPNNIDYPRQFSAVPHPLTSAYR